MWYWGWHHRKEGAIPADLDEAAEAIPIRRFLCLSCNRTFSWRPALLAFAHRLGALVYQQALKAMALGQRHAGSQAWFELGQAGHKAFLARIRRRAPELCRRLGLDPADPTPLWPRIWSGLRRRAREMTRQTGQPRAAIHILCLALARHRNGTLYRLSAS